MKVDKEVASARYSICKSCENFDDLLKICKRCGCFMKFKVHLKSSECPLNKWKKEE